MLLQHQHQLTRTLKPNEVSVSLSPSLDAAMRTEDIKRKRGPHLLASDWLVLCLRSQSKKKTQTTMGEVIQE